MKRPTIVSAERGGTQRFSLGEAASLTGLQPHIIVECVQAQYVWTRGSDPAGSPCFDESGILRLRKIEELREDHRIGIESIRVVLLLLDRLEAAEREVRQLRERLR